ncbi:MAG: T9SS type A sorting domain-containing protein [bacterium]
MFRKILALGTIFYAFLFFARESAGQQFVPLTAKEAVERAAPVAAQWAADARLIFVGSGPEPGMYPDGKCDFWVCAYYSPAKDSTYNFYATKVGPVSFESRPKEGYPSLNGIGMDWKDSSTAGRKAEQLGGSQFRAKYSDTIVGASVTYETIFEHTQHPRWGFWWTFTYFSASAQTFIKLHFNARSTRPAPTWTISSKQPAQNQDIAFTTPNDDTLAVLNLSSGALDSVKVEVFEGYLPDTAATENTMKKYYDISSYPEGAPFEGTLTLFYMDAEFEASGIQDEAGLQLYRHDGQRWQLVGGTADPQQNSVTATGVTEFSQWTFANPNDQPLSIENAHIQQPEDFVLWQNYPNPFNPATTIHFAIPKSSLVTLRIYNLLGQEIETLVDEQKPAGEYKVNWAPRNLSSGIYLYRLQAGEIAETRKLMLLR